jgi:hypothetical protein
MAEDVLGLFDHLNWPNDAAELLQAGEKSSVMPAASLNQDN